MEAILDCPTEHTPRKYIPIARRSPHQTLPWTLHQFCPYPNSPRCKPQQPRPPLLLPRPPLPRHPPPSPTQKQKTNRFRPCLPALAPALVLSPAPARSRNPLLELVLAVVCSVVSFFAAPSPF